MKEKDIDLGRAIMAVKEIVEGARKDGGDPVAITILGTDKEVILQAAMPGVMPVSIELSKNKAYTALMTNKDTSFWADQEGQSELLLNFADERFTFFPGGVLVLGDDSSILGAVGVSGRKGRKEKGDDPESQDNELAQRVVYLLKDFIKRSLYMW